MMIGEGTMRLKVEEPALARREALAAGPLSSVAIAALIGRLAAPAIAAPAASGDVALDYVRLRAEPSGKPVYWLSRGTRYLLADFQIVPLHAMNMASAVVAARDPAGGFVVRALEGAYAAGLDGGEASAFANPVDGTRLPVTIAPAQTVAYRYLSDGRMLLPDDPMRPTSAQFEGAIASRPPFAGEHAVEERFVSRGAAGILSELITFAGAPAADGAVADAAKTVIVLRNWPYGDAGGKLLLAVYEGRKFASLDALMAQVNARALQAAQPGLSERLAAFT